MTNLKTKYTYEEVMFVVKQAHDEYIKIKDLDLRSKFPIDYKKRIYKKFVENFGNMHPFDSVKMLIDNILANWRIKGYLNFSKGSKTVQEVAIQYQINI